AANRGENVSCVFINNGIYGMTGGQMAPTTLLKEKTVTSPWGRNPDKGDGYPLKVSEMLAGLRGVGYVERVSVSTPVQVAIAKKAVIKAFQQQLDKKGFSLVEVLSQCPTVWGKTPVEAVGWMKDNMEKYFPLGRIK
ncbi:MAG: thiamine pyrophosphate-dependent enzyme, partial [Candidatus Omnitrophica bacterium]|nr:thiamine pyrophosphate-dependent enzyme [Candidatus Omnitrophota bacterium]